MNKPTQEQIRDFWEWCGLTYEKDYIHDKQIGAEFVGVDYEKECWRDNGGILVSTITPDLDLNNLFKYAVPKLDYWTITNEAGHYEDKDDTLFAFEIGATVSKSGFKDSTYYGGWKYGQAKDKDPALALFWAIWEIIKEGK